MSVGAVNENAYSGVATTDDGAKLRFWSQGSGPRTLFLVSGLGGTGGFWSDVAATLGAAARIIRFDQRGIGESTRGTAELSIERLAEDCLTVLDAAGAGNCVLLGHSTGGCIAQACARIAPERAEGLILSATWMRRSRYMTALFETRREMLENQPLIYAKSAALLSFPPAWLEENWHVYDAAVAKAPIDATAGRIVKERIDALLAFDGPGEAGLPDLPTLVLGAHDDMIVPPFLQEQLGTALAVSQTVMFDQGGHFFPLTRGDAFCASISAWMAEL